MKSTFIGTVLFAVAIVNQVSAVKPQPGDGSVYVDQATLDKYYDECEDLTVDTCANSPHCEVLRNVPLLGDICDVKANYKVGTAEQIAASTKQ